MKITVFGASGRVGRLVVDLLLAADHQVMVFVHSGGSFTETDRLKIAKGDVHDAVSVAQALQGSEAVISTLGSWGTSTKDILGAAMANIIPAMQEQHINRIITLTGSGAWAPADTITTSNKVGHALFGLIAGAILRDGEQHLRLLSESALQWTTLRAGIMKNGAAGEYLLNDKLPSAWETISRATVAQAMVDQLNDQSRYGKAPHIHEV